MPLIAKCQACDRRYRVSSKLRAAFPPCQKCGGALQETNEFVAHASAAAVADPNVAGRALEPLPPNVVTPSPPEALYAPPPIVYPGPAIAYVIPPIAIAHISPPRRAAGIFCLVYGILGYVFSGILLLALLVGVMVADPPMAGPQQVLFLLFALASTSSATGYMICRGKIRAGGFASAVVALVITGLVTLAHVRALVTETLSFDPADLQNREKRIGGIALGIVLIASDIWFLAVLSKVLREPRPGAGQRPTHIAPRTALWLGGLLGSVVGILLGSGLMALLIETTHIASILRDGSILLLFSLGGAAAGAAIRSNHWRNKNMAILGEHWLAMVASLRGWIVLSICLAGTIGLPYGVKMLLYPHHEGLHRAPHENLANNSVPQQLLSPPQDDAPDDATPNDPRGMVIHVQHQPRKVQNFSDQSTDEDRARLVQLSTQWHGGQVGEVIDMMAHITGDAEKSRPADGSHILTNGSRLESAFICQAPMDLRIICKSRGDVRIGFPARQIIFNWEMDHADLRIDGDAAGTHHLKGAGSLPEDQWNSIELVVLPDQLTVYVNGEQRYHATADLSNERRRFSIEAHTGMVQVKSVKYVKG